MHFLRRSVAQVLIVLSCVLVFLWGYRLRFMGPHGLTTRSQTPVPSLRDSPSNVVRILMLSISTQVNGFFRIAHRQTWMQETCNSILTAKDGTQFLIDTLFAVAPTNNPILRDRAARSFREEQEQYRDILLLPHVEPGKQNLTLRIWWMFQEAMKLPMPYHYYVRADEDLFPVWSRMIDIPGFIPRKPEDNVIFAKAIPNNWVRPPVGSASTTLFEELKGPTPVCPGGEMYGLSRNIVQEVLQNKKAEAQATSGLGGMADDVYFCSWLSLTTTKLKRNYVIHPGHHNHWAHSGDLKDVRNFVKCYTDSNGCKGEKGNTLVHPIWQQIK